MSEWVAQNWEYILIAVYALEKIVKLTPTKYDDILFAFHSTSEYSQLIRDLIVKEGLKNCEVISDENAWLNVAKVPKLSNFFFLKKVGKYFSVLLTILINGLIVRWQLPIILIHPLRKCTMKAT